MQSLVDPTMQLETSTVRLKRAIEQDLLHHVAHTVAVAGIGTVQAEVLNTLAHLHSSRDARRVALAVEEHLQ